MFCDICGMVKIKYVVTLSKQTFYGEWTSEKNKDVVMKNIVPEK